MITDRKEALDYINKNRKGRVIDLEKVIDSETIKGHQVGGNLFVDFCGNYNFTKENIKVYKYLYRGKMNFLDKVECFIGNVGIYICEFLSGQNYK